VLLLAVELNKDPVFDNKALQLLTGLLVGGS